MPWLDSREQYLADIDETARGWADSDMWDEMLQLTGPSLQTREERIAFSRPLRLSVSPGNVVPHLRANADTDVRDILPTVRVPTLVLCRSLPDRPIALTAPYVAERIPTARLAYSGDGDPIPVLGDREPMQAEMRRFVEDVVSETDKEPDTVLATVLFTDIVGSTAKAAELGDRGWHELLGEHHDRIRRELSRFRGREVDTAGDGFFATFDGPARAIRCACAAIESVQALGIEIRAGLHTGECELRRREGGRHRRSHRRTRLGGGGTGRGARVQHGEGARGRLRPGVRRSGPGGAEGRSRRVAALRRRALSRGLEPRPQVREAVQERVQRPGRRAGVPATEDDDLALQLRRLREPDRLQVPASSSPATAVWGRSATPSPCSTIFFAASMLSSSITPRGTAPAPRKNSFVSRW